MLVHSCLWLNRLRHGSSTQSLVGFKIAFEKFIRILEVSLHAKLKKSSCNPFEASNENCPFASDLCPEVYSFSLHISERFLGGTCE